MAVASHDDISALWPDGKYWHLKAVHLLYMTLIQEPQFWGCPEDVGASLKARLGSESRVDIKLDDNQGTVGASSLHIQCRDEYVMR